MVFDKLYSFCLFMEKLLICNPIAKLPLKN